MPDLPTRLDLYALGRDYIKSRATRIDPNQVDVEGTDVNIFVGSTSVLAAYLIRQLAYSINRLLLDGAEGEDLDRYAYDRYGLTRKGASSAVGIVRIFRATNAGGAGTVPIGTVINSLTGIQYITTTSSTFGSTDLTTTAYVRAVQAGKATQVGANSLRKFQNTAVLFDATLNVNNDAAMTGGEDAEDDDTFRNRIRDFWRTARRGILAAIEQGALTVPGVVSAQASEAIEIIGTTTIPARVVNLYIADSSGVANAALAQQVQVALLDYRAGGITVIISPSLPFLVNISLSLTFRAGVDTLTLTDAVKASIVEFVNSLAVNGTLYLSQLYSVLQRFAEDGLIVNQSSIIAPATDLVPAIGQTIRTTLTNLTVTTPPAS